MLSNLPKIDEGNSIAVRPEPTRLVSRRSLCRRLARSPEARAQFTESTINKGLAYQLRAMREARNWSQEDLAALVGMPQTAISRLESPNYGKQTITTLKRMARVYDVGLDVRFVPFSVLMDRMSKTPRMDFGLTSDSVDVPSFEEEVTNGVFDNQPSTFIPTYVSNIRFQFPVPENAGVYRNAIDVALQSSIGITPLQYLTVEQPKKLTVDEHAVGVQQARPFGYSDIDQQAVAAPITLKKRPDCDYLGMNQPIAVNEARI